MARKSWILPAIALACNSLALPPSANADAVDNWCTTYVSTYKGHLHRITIRKDDDKVKIRTFGTGFPDAIDWGESAAEVYADEADTFPDSSHTIQSVRQRQCLLYRQTQAATPPMRAEQLFVMCI